MFLTLHADLVEHVVVGVIRIDLELVIEWVGFVRIAHLDLHRGELKDGFLFGLLL